ncbi:MAG: MarR family winged helix-turn-helix transcriptional regulator [Fusicatenibacter sp.]|nr:MarR family winged helix-turn-helix transcriptional regulator [Fusicatenibacter sp.]
MTEEKLRRLLDACFAAKRIVETLPELPDGMKPRHIHVLEAIWEQQNHQGFGRVSDISAQLEITMPSITKLVQELEGMGMLKKETDPKDRRVSFLYLTEAGRDCVERYVTQFHREWAEALPDISDQQAEEVIQRIARLGETMPGRKEVKYGSR